jgi:hypothetical protein
MVLALLVLALPGAVRAQADGPGRAGRLVPVQGTVWLYDATEGEWISAPRNRPLTTGDHLATDPDARAELWVGSTVVRVGGSAQLTVTQLDDRRFDLQLDSGSLALRVYAPEAANETAVRTPEGSFQPLQPGHYRIDRERDGSTATTWTGELRFEAQDSALNVRPGERAEFWQVDRVTHYQTSGPAFDAFGDWALAEDRRAPQPLAGRPVSPEMTGAEDLDRYGRWERDSSYGTVWVPATVAPGWAPYRYGHWAWVSPWGWTWIDDAPWGFAPFHYGRWAWAGGRWCWVPGAYAARPAYAPALVGWVGGAGIGVSIGIGNRPAYGWVPLAPGEAYRPHGPGPGGPHGYNDDGRRRAPNTRWLYANQAAPSALTVVPAEQWRPGRPVQGVAPRLDGGRFAGNEGLNRAAPPPFPQRPGERGRPDFRPGEGGRPEWRPGDGRPGDGRPGDGRPGWRPGDVRPGDGRPGDGRPGDDGRPGWRPGSPQAGMPERPWQPGVPATQAPARPALPATTMPPNAVPSTTLPRSVVPSTVVPPTVVPPSVVQPAMPQAGAGQPPQRIGVQPASPEAPPFMHRRPMPQVPAATVPAAAVPAPPALPRPSIQAPAMPSAAPVSPPPRAVAPPVVTPPAVQAVPMPQAQPPYGGHERGRWSPAGGAPAGGPPPGAAVVPAPGAGGQPGGPGNPDGMRRVPRPNGGGNGGGNGEQRGPGWR